MDLVGGPELAVVADRMPAANLAAEVEPAPGADPAEDSDSGSPIGAAGHRARMRQRLLRAGPKALADHEMLEMVLFLALPRCDTKPIARVLLRRFGSFGGVIGAPPADLLAVDGIGEAGAAALKLVHAGAARLLKQPLTEAPLLTSWDRVTDYLRAEMANEPVEQFRILFLDARNRLIADEVQGRGTIGHTPAYPREVVRRALELHATAVGTGAQPSKRGANAVARGYCDDTGHPACSADNGDHRARPHHRRAGRLYQLACGQSVLSRESFPFPARTH